MEEPAKIEEPQRMKESEETPQKMEEAIDFVVKRVFFFLA